MKGVGFLHFRSSYPLRFWNRFRSVVAGSLNAKMMAIACTAFRQLCQCSLDFLSLAHPALPRWMFPVPRYRQDPGTQPSAKKSPHISCSSIDRPWIKNKVNMH